MFGIGRKKEERPPLDTPPLDTPSIADIIGRAKAAGVIPEYAEGNRTEHFALSPTLTLPLYSVDAKSVSREDEIWASSCIPRTLLWR